MGCVGQVERGVRDAGQANRPLMHGMLDKLTPIGDIGMLQYALRADWQRNQGRLGALCRQGMTPLLADHPVSCAPDNCGTLLPDRTGGAVAAGVASSLR
jgi:hypothetical protein